MHEPNYHWFKGGPLTSCRVTRFAIGGMAQCKLVGSRSSGEIYSLPLVGAEMLPVREKQDILWLTLVGMCLVLLLSLLKDERQQQMSVVW